MMAIVVMSWLAAGGIWAERVEIKTPTGRLVGVLERPSGAGPWSVVLLHPGSGPTDRDGNQGIMKNNSLRQLGHALVLQGVAVLRIDKRGVGASRAALKQEADANLDLYAADAACWLRFLRDDRRFNRVFFAGHSEGALIGLVAVQETPVDGTILLAGPGRRFSDLLREQLKTKLDDTLNQANEKILRELEAGRLVDTVPEDLMVLYRPSVQPFLISAFRRDPAVEITKIKGPVLIIQGSTDIQVRVVDANRLAASRPGARVQVVKGMNHVFKPLSDIEDQLAQLKTYLDPSVPIVPTVPGVMADFVRCVR